MTILSYLASGFVYRVTALIVFLLIAHNAWTQVEDHDMISGRVLDSLTGQPVAYANVYLTSDISKGTATDSTGIFILFPGSQNNPVPVHISCIGYEAKTVRLSSGGRLAVIKLAQAPVMLDELEISERKIAPKTILQEAFSLQDSLLKRQDFKYTVLYQGNAFVSEDVSYNLDIVMEQFYLPKDNRIIVDLNILEERDLSKGLSTDIKRVFFELGTWNFYKHSFACNLTEPECATQIDINNIKVKEYERKDVIIIDYTLKPNSNLNMKRFGETLASESGSVYIEASSSIILRHEMDILYIKKDNAFYRKNIRKNFYPRKLKIIRNYNERDNHYNLSYYLIERKDIMVEKAKRPRPVFSKHALRVIGIEHGSFIIPEKVTPFINTRPFQADFWIILDKKLKAN